MNTYWVYLLDGSTESILANNDEQAIMIAFFIYTQEKIEEIVEECLPGWACTIYYMGAAEVERCIMQLKQVSGN